MSDWDDLMEHIEGTEVKYDPFFEEQYAKAIAQDDIAEEIADWDFGRLKYMKEFIYEYWLQEKERLGGEWKEIQADEAAGEQGG